MKKEIKSRNHALCEKAPLLAIVLGCILAMVLISIPGLIGLSGVADNLLSSLIAFIFLVAFNRWFAPEFQGVFRLGVSGKELCIVLAPFIFEFVGTYVASVFDAGFYFHPTVSALAMGIAAGFCEETMFRAVTVPIGMRYLKSRNRIYIIVFASALVFGVLHIGNIFQGANPALAVIQGVATIFGGFLFIALYLRTGSMWVPIVTHGVFDYMCFVSDPTLDNGVMKNEAVTSGVVVSLVLYVIAGVWALYLIRPAVKDKIEALWDEKWGVL